MTASWKTFKEDSKSRGLLDRSIRKAQWWTAHEDTALYPHSRLAVRESDAQMLDLQSKSFVDCESEFPALKGVLTPLVSKSKAKNMNTLPTKGPWREVSNTAIYWAYEGSWSKIEWSESLGSWGSRVEPFWENDKGGWEGSDVGFAFIEIILDRPHEQCGRSRVGSPRPPLICKRREGAVANRWRNTSSVLWCFTVCVFHESTVFSIHSDMLLWAGLRHTALAPSFAAAIPAISYGRRRWWPNPDDLQIHTQFWASLI